MKTAQKLLALIIVVGILFSFAFQIDAAATSTAAYNSIPDPLPGNLPSQPYQAQQAAEFGDHIRFDGTARKLSSVTITMSSWAKHTDYPELPEAGFTHPLTLNLYQVDQSGESPALGALIGTITQDFVMQWRPEGDPTCPNTGYGPGFAWRAANDTCYNGYVFNVVFDLSQANLVLPDEIIFGVASNTETWGYAPIGAAGPYNSLNFALNSISGASIGTDVEPDAAFFNTQTAQWYSDGGAGGTGTFRRDTGWTGYVPAVRFEMEEAVTPALTVEVRDSAGNPIEGASVIYATGSPNAGWTTFGITGADGLISRSDLVPGVTYHFYTQYNASTSQQQFVTYDGSDTLTFQTTQVKAKVETCPGVALEGAVVTYGSVNGGFLNFGTTGSDGVVAKELFPGFERTFYASFNHTSSPMQTSVITSQVEPLVTFKTTAVSLYHSGPINFGSPNGGWYSFTKPTMELFSGTRTFLMSGVQVPIDVNGCSISKSLNVLKLKDHNGQPMSSGIARGGYGSAFGTWHVPGVTDANGLLLELRDVSTAPTTMSYEMRYNNTTQVKTQDVSANSVFEFQTNQVNMRLQACDGTGLSGGSVRYGYGSTYTTAWFPGGATNANGDTSAEFFPGTYSFEMQYQGTAETRMNVSLPDGSPVVWNTTRVALQYAGEISYGGPTGQNAWFTKPAMNLLPGGPYKFHFQYPEGGRLDLSWSGCEFTNSVATVKLINSAGVGIAGATAQYYDGGWKNIPGTTDASGLLPVAIPGLKGSLPFSVSYGGATIQKTQNISTTSVVTFQTKAVTMSLLSSTGETLTGSAEYYAAGWKTFGTGATTATMELLPANYPFRVSYAGASIQKNQDINDNPSVVFNTFPVTLTLVDSLNNPITDAGAEYYANGWKLLGSGKTAASMELLPVTYPFRVNYAGASVQKNQNVATNPQVVFQTRLVTFKLLDSLGNAITNAGTDYYANGWKIFGSGKTETSMELLPTTYPFRVSYAGASVQKNQNVDIDPIVAFQTKAVTVKLLNSDSSIDLTAGANFYASGWKVIGPTPASIELLGTSYPFSVSYLGASIQKNQDVSANPVVVFNTTKVTLQLVNSSGEELVGIGRFYANGWKDFGTATSTLEMLPTTYPFSMTYGGATIQKNQNVAAFPVVTFATVPVTFKLLDSTGSNELVGAADYYANGWRTFGTGETSAVAELLPTTYPFRVTYGGASIQKNQDVSTAPLVIFNTKLVTMKLLDSSNTELAGNSEYYASGWKPFGNGTTTTSMQLLPANYPFKVTYNGASLQKSQDVNLDPVVVFTGTKVTLQFSGNIEYYAGGWKTFTKPTTNLLPGTYPFRFSGTGIPAVQTNFVVGGADIVNSVAYLRLISSKGAGIKDASSQYYGSGWQSIPGTTNSVGAVIGFLPGLQKSSLTFKMIHAGAALDKNQNISLDSFVVFQTTNVEFQLQDHTGALGALPGEGTAQFYASGWKEIGPTIGGKINIELLPLNYTFRMVYAGAQQEFSQNVAVNALATFKTTLVNIQLKDSAGMLSTLPAPGTVQYYASGWKDIGPTVNGEISIELLPLTYPFSMTYAGARVEKSQHIASNPNISFQTTAVEFQLQNSDGETGMLPGEGTVLYYASGWKTIGQTAAGKIGIELLPVNYPFRMVYAGGQQEYSQNVAVNPLAIFKTGKVFSLSSSCTQYYAGGWKPFSQNMELLPGNYPFTFTGFPQTTYTVTSGIVNNIH